jgi:ADP-ribose pyrophosphatase YjhB (NUDIX family)
MAFAENLRRSSQLLFPPRTTATSRSEDSDGDLALACESGWSGGNLEKRHNLPAANARRFRGSPVSAKHVSMPIPEFIIELRRHLGHASLWLPCVTAVVIRDRQVLLIKRADNQAWTPVTGIVEPGENPADCAVREVFEEAGIHVIARRLAWVHVTRPIVHANGDRAQYLDHVFRMEWAGGEPFPADDESLDAGWFDLLTLPDMSGDMRRRIETASSYSPGVGTVFDTKAAAVDEDVGH